ncbi:TPA: TolC family protein [Klebsiella pneumoniae]|nr:TolC family protein [Klebsiella pneumoniae]
MRSIQLLTLSVIFTLTGCLSLAPDYQRPAAPVPQQFSLSQNRLVAATAGYQETGWRTFFVDPQVKSLISTALTNNRDLRMATLKVQEARAQYRVTDADRYPQLNGDGSTTYGGKLKGDTTTSSDYAAGLNLSYDLDFFGRLKNLSEADRQNFFASEEARRAVHILLIANVSQSYFNQRLAAAQLQVVNYEQKIQSAFKEVADALALRQSLADQIAAQERYLASLNITLQRATALYRHGAVSYIEVLSAQRDIFTTRQTLLELNYSRQANEITLFTALGGGWME